MRTAISKPLLALLVIATAMLLHAAPVAAKEGDRANAVIFPMMLVHHDTSDGGDSLASTLIIGYEHDPRGGYGAELFGSAVIMGPEEGLLYGANFSLIAPHGPHPLVRGKLIFGMGYCDYQNESFNNHLFWQSGVRLELGRHVFTPLVVEGLYRSLKVDGGNGGYSFSKDLSDFVFNIGFGFRFP